jgi:hypothetical protein
MRPGTLKLVHAAGLATALVALVPEVARAQVPIIDSSSYDQPPPAKPAPAPAPAGPLDLQQPGAPAPAPAPSPVVSAGASVDTVFLKDGSTIKGHILKQSPGSFVTIKSAAGEMTIAWDQVDRVVAGAGGDTVVDSSKTTGGLEGKGVGLGISGEHVVQLHDPTNHFWQFAIDGGVTFGTSTDSSNTTLIGGGLNLNVQYRVGAQMPGKEGGSWNAFGLDLSAGLAGFAALFPDGMGGSNGAGGLLLNTGVAAGYQFMTFGKMDDNDLKQHGFGLFLGGKVGVANVQTFATQVQGQTIPGTSNTNAQYGPQIQLTFPEYNFGSTQRAAFYISGFVLPTGNFLIASIQFGGSFN